MKAVLCGLAWSYDSKGRVAYLMLKSSITGRELTLRRPYFAKLPKPFLDRVKAFLARVYVPKTPAELERFKGWLKAPFAVEDMVAFRAAFEAQARELHEGARI